MSEFEPPKAMVEAVAESIKAHVSFSGGATFIGDAETAIATIIAYLSDPANAEDAKAWAEATMEKVEVSSTYDGISVWSDDRGKYVDDGDTYTATFYRPRTR